MHCGRPLVASAYEHLDEKSARCLLDHELLSQDLPGFLSHVHLHMRSSVDDSSDRAQAPRAGGPRQGRTSKDDELVPLLIDTPNTLSILVMRVSPA